MRLVDLDPNWAHCDGRDRVGVTFLCPLHREACIYGKLGVPFSNPIDGLGPSRWATNGGWKRDGESFETLTLSPSIKVLDSIDGKIAEHWHGFITKGEVK